ncbi:type II CAAX prenyl endopeptidase Rce1 family protein [Thalassobacillus sp. CUG 92003]|uniref:CPBP family glutamic-type intramembrane protease n=1 Tax=Thalassobacillus sp. CUG 92003 TaxID=2736641 RepID=UPI00351A8858
MFFAAGHLPRDLVEWIDLIVPSTAYTVLYLYTKRLTASMVAHGLWNTLVAILVIIIYS